MRRIRTWIILPLLLLAVLLPAFGIFASDAPDRLADNAELLTGSEQESVREKLDDVSEKYQCDVVVVTAVSLQGKTAEAYADDYFDYNGYGYGSDRSGIMLLVAINERKWAFSPRGEAIHSFTDDGLAYMEEEVLPYLSDDDYAGGFKKFASLCETFLKKAEDGTPYYGDNMPKTALPLEVTGAVALGGIALGFGGTAIMKGQLKSVRAKDTATDYVRQGSFQLNRQADTYLYSRVTKVPRPKDTDRGGGGHSSTHMGSSGASHGGRSGSF